MLAIEARQGEQHRRAITSAILILRDCKTGIVNSLLDGRTGDAGPGVLRVSGDAFLKKKKGQGGIRHQHSHREDLAEVTINNMGRNTT
jgi:hypothetical protein